MASKEIYYTTTLEMHLIIIQLRLIMNKLDTTLNRIEDHNSLDSLPITERLMQARSDFNLGNTSKDSVICLGHRMRQKRVRRIISKIHTKIYKVRRKF